MTLQHAGLSSVMKRHKDLKSEIVSRLKGGRLNTPELLFQDTTEDEFPKWAEKVINASSQFRLTDGIVKGSNGNSVPALAFWETGFRVHIKERVVRIWVLTVQRKDGRYYYGIPANAAQPIELPNSGFTAEETRLLLRMADTISGNVQKREKDISVPHPAENTVVSQRQQWLKIDFDHNALYSAFASTALNVEILAATLDAQFPILGDVKNIPRGITVFVTVPSDDIGREYVQAVSSAVTFANEPSLFQSGLIELQSVNGAEREQYPERVSMIWTRQSTVKIVPRILDAIAHENQSQMAGNPTRSLSDGFPLIVTDEPIRSRFALNIEVPDGLELLTGETLDLFRAAASRLVQSETLDECRKRWKNRMNQPDAYRLNGFHEWRKIIKKSICDALFKGSDCYEQARNMTEHGIGKLESANQGRIAEIIKYYQNLNDVESFPHKADIQPDVHCGAFQHQFTQGKYRGKAVIGFSSKEALIETFADAGLTPGLLPAFLREMRNQNFLLTDKDRDTLKVDVGGKKVGCYVFVDPRSLGSTVPDR